MWPFSVAMPVLMDDPQASAGLRSVQEEVVRNGSAIRIRSLPLFAGAAAGLTLCLVCPGAWSQPEPGDTFREYVWFNEKGDAGRALRVGGRLGFEGAFGLTAGTVILVSRETCREGEYLSQMLSQATSLKLPVEDLKEEEGRPNGIVLRLEDDGRLGDEGYRLDVRGDRVVAEAAEPAGIFYACQTLRQLLPAAVEGGKKPPGVAWVVPRVTIEDTPRFSWRGFMLDSGRCFHPRRDAVRRRRLAARPRPGRTHGGAGSTGQGPGRWPGSTLTSSLA